MMQRAFKAVKRNRSWIRMRLRAMKLKRKNYSDNQKLRNTYFTKKRGLLTLDMFYIAQDAVA